MRAWASLPRTTAGSSATRSMHTGQLAHTHTRTNEACAVPGHGTREPARANGSAPAKWAHPPNRGFFTQQLLRLHHLETGDLLFSTTHRTRWSRTTPPTLKRDTWPGANQVTTRKTTTQHPFIFFHQQHHRSTYLYSRPARRAARARAALRTSPRARWGRQGHDLCSTQPLLLRCLVALPLR